MPPLIPLEDANDLIDFFEYSHRTIPRDQWAEESIAAATMASLDGLF